MKTNTKKSSNSKKIVKKTNNSSITAMDSKELIRQRAFEIHLETGNHDEHENWLQAEGEILQGK